jgi:hypothetical protein
MRRGGPHAEAYRGGGWPIATLDHDSAQAPRMRFDAEYPKLFEAEWIARAGQDGSGSEGPAAGVSSSVGVTTRPRCAAPRRRRMSSVTTRVPRIRAAARYSAS